MQGTLRGKQPGQRRGGDDLIFDDDAACRAASWRARMRAAGFDDDDDEDLYAFVHAEAHVVPHAWHDECDDIECSVHVRRRARTSRVTERREQNVYGDSGQRRSSAPVCVKLRVCFLSVHVSIACR